MLKIETFTSSDWDTFAGAQCFSCGGDPLTAEKDGVLYVADDESIVKIDEEREEETVIRFEHLTVTQDQAAEMLKILLG